jgi:putative DNA primase/helicase
MIPPETWKNEVCAGFDPAMVAQALESRGILERAPDGRLSNVKKIEGRSTRVYVIKPAIIAEEGYE